jgi:hypothetical protein
MDAFLKFCKQLIEIDNLEGLQEFYMENQSENYPWEYIYQKLYLHACLKKKHRIVTWLKEMFEQFDPIQKIALRQMFSYGKYLLAK